MSERLSADPGGPTLAEQVSRLYDLIAGHHLTNLVEIAREVGIWEVVTARPGIESQALATALGIDAHYTDILCRTAFAFGFLERDAHACQLAPHMHPLLR